jgi:hypothetical protein
MKYDYEPLKDSFIEYAYPLALDKYKEQSQSIPHIMYQEGLNFDFDEWHDNHSFQLEQIFEIDYKLLTEREIYFYGCGFNVYKNTYDERLNSFLIEFPDAGELDFCEYELEKKVNYISPHLLNLKIGFSINKRNEFLNEKKIQLTTQTQQKQTLPHTENSLKWQGTNLEFTELVKALFEANKLNPDLTQTEIYKRLKLFFNIDEFNENDKLKDIRKRTNTKTPLLHVLETSLNNWITKKD